MAEHRIIHNWIFFPSEKQSVKRNNVCYEVFCIKMVVITRSGCICTQPRGIKLYFFFGFLCKTLKDSLLCG
jgi:hypothetical protein